MQIVYLLLLSILLFSYWKTVRKLFAHSVGLTPLLGWIVGLAFFVLAPLTIMTINGGFEMPKSHGVGQEWGSVDLTTSKFLIPYLVIWLCMMLCCLVLYIFPPPASLKGTQDASAPISRRWNVNVILLAMVISIVTWLFLIWLVGGLELFIVSHWYDRTEELVSRYGLPFLLFEHIASANQVLFTCATCLYTARGLKERDAQWGMSAIILLFYLLQIVILGNRIYFAIYLLACFTSCMLSRRWKLLVPGLALIPALVFVFSAWAMLRGSVSTIPDAMNGYVESVDRGNRPVTALMDVTEGMDTQLLLHVVKDYGIRYDYLYGATYSRLLLSFVPRSIYPQRSDNLTVILAHVYLPGVGTSLNATVLGEMYANFGPFTIVLMPLATIGVLYLTQWASRRECNHPMLPVLLFFFVLWITRATFAENVIECLFTYAFIYVLRIEQWNSITETMKSRHVYLLPAQ